MLTVTKSAKGLTKNYRKPQLLLQNLSKIDQQCQGWGRWHLLPPPIPWGGGGNKCQGFFDRGKIRCFFF